MTEFSLVKAHSLVQTNLETGLRPCEKGQSWAGGIRGKLASQGELSGGGGTLAGP